MELTGLVEARLLSVADIKVVAERRSRLHANHVTRRSLSSDYDFIGLMGQWEFARQFGLNLDLTDRLAGDGRINFVTDIGTISVSTYRKPYNLLREVGKECARYHVLARFNEKKVGWRDCEYKVDLLGWESDEDMLKCPARYFGYDVHNHYKHVADLRPIIELRYLLLGEGIQAKLL
jgi:hypothetical protein